MTEGIEQEQRGEIVQIQEKRENVQSQEKGKEIGQAQEIENETGQIQEIERETDLQKEGGIDPKIEISRENVMTETDQENDMTETDQEIDTEEVDPMTVIKENIQTNTRKVNIVGDLLVTKIVLFVPANIQIL